MHSRHVKQFYVYAFSFPLATTGGTAEQQPCGRLQKWNDVLYVIQHASNFCAKVVLCDSALC